MKRFPRLSLKLEWKAADLRRALHWHLGGGRSHFRRRLSGILEQHRWCFVVGCNNSGTSLLHAALEASGEVSVVPYEGQRFTVVLPRADRWGYERVWTEYADALSVPDDASLDRVARLVHDWWQELEEPVRPVIVEKTPANVLRLGWLQRAFPGSRFIALVRNGYAVAEGIRRKGGKSLSRGARHWREVCRVLLDDGPALEQLMVVRYEDMVESPEETARKIAGFLQIRADPLIEAFAGEFSFSNIRGARSMKLRNLDRDSLVSLSLEDRHTIRRWAGDMLDHFGYGPAPSDLQGTG